MKRKDKKKKEDFSLEESYLAALKKKTEPEPLDIPDDIRAILSEDGTNDMLPPQETGQHTGRLHVTISPDRMNVSLQANKCPAFTSEQILRQIIEKGVVYGIDKEAVAKAELLLGKTGGWPGDLIVARGTEPPEPPSISYPFLTHVEKTNGNYKWLVKGVELPFAEVRYFFNSDSISSLAPEILLVKAVSSGQTIAEFDGKLSTETGKDVFGTEAAHHDLYLQPGENVHYNHEKNIYQSMTYGYLCIEDNKISIIPPLWISPDKMSAYYINLPQIDEPTYPSAKNLTTILTLAGINKNVIHREILEQLSRRLASGKNLPLHVRVASGFKPKQGADAEFRLFIDAEMKAGQIRNDDTIDLRERNIVQRVRKGQLLAEKIHAEQGVSGLTLFGENIKARHGSDIKIKAEKGVISKDNVGKTLYYAKCDGNISIKDYVLSVANVFSVKGDVDYSTGNIDVNSDLEIGGSIKPGFSVRAEGNVIIHGTVESSVSLFANGDLLVENGIIGESTKAIVLGNLQADFIQDAEIMVKGDVKIKSYLFNCRLCSGGSVEVLKSPGSKGGKVIGGTVCAAKGIQVSTVGSSSNQNTVISIQVALEIKNKVSLLEEQLAECSEQIVKIMRTLNLPDTDPEKIRELLSQLPQNKREAFVKILSNLNALIKHQNVLKEQKNGIKEKIDLFLKKARIRILNQFYMGNKVEIGDKKFMARTDMGTSVFRLDGDVIVCE
ncbi:MAG: FapA family protein [Desulfobulbaceae bacterium]|nr:FapA family protein [Desulfobulbaceae bacterium]